MLKNIGICHDLILGLELPKIQGWSKGHENYRLLRDQNQKIQFFKNLCVFFIN